MHGVAHMNMSARRPRESHPCKLIVVYGCVLGVGKRQLGLTRAKVYRLGLGHETLRFDGPSRLTTASV